MAFKVTLIRSTISAKPKSRGTVRALGLRKIGDTNTLPDRPEIRGMLRRVPHLIRVETIADDEIVPAVVPSGLVETSTNTES